MLETRDEHGPTISVQRADYTAPAFWIDTVDLTFDLDPVKTRVLNKMRLRRNPEVPVQALRLDGDELNLSRVLVNGASASFKIDGGKLVLENLPAAEDGAFDLEIFTTCAPAKNTKLMGLYVSNDSFFTQCEAEGFRRITYFLDRPDVMATYTVLLRASKAAYPVLLSNGNLVDSGDLAGDGNTGRHFARWADPHRKPSYLFALVAGQLESRQQRIVSRAGKEHLLEIYVRRGDLGKTEYAMQSLMASIAWDEARFGLSLDLERFMVVATSDFNMGAMENKGLNIFNTKYVLATQATATDTDFSGIESVVGHEYFHNWTGNRVTCRDWFQLSLKEGLTVFRDQEFSQDLCQDASARAVKRIDDVRVLRTAQFPEDAGPMAHPVRPDSYVEINNFYTVTVYEKGAEVVRMMQTLVGRAGFAKGMKLYFERHDGQAVTCDDFAQAQADANPTSDLARLLPQFKRWYGQAGTPHVQAGGHYDAAAATYTLTLTQSCKPTPGQPDKQAFVIPLSIGLVGPHGEDLPLQLADEAVPTMVPRTFVLGETALTLCFVNVAAEPVPSILRGFSAPVVLEFDYSDAQLLHLLAHDSDPFNRWEAGQRLAMRCALAALERPFDGPVVDVLTPQFLDAMRGILRHQVLDAAFKDLTLTLPSETYIAEQLTVVDPQHIHAVRESMRLQLATALADDWQQAWQQNRDTGAYRPDPVSCGKRALAGMALSMLCLGAANDLWPGKAFERYKHAGNMTDRLHALSALVGCAHPLGGEALSRFHAQFKGDELVLDKWFALQASASDRAGHVLPLVTQLMSHPDFHLKNPNRARSLLFAYCNGNPGAFHRHDAAGYQFWSLRVMEIDAFNPQLAARLARALDRWSRLAEPYRGAAREAIAKVAAKPDLSNDVREVVSRALAA